MIVWEKQYMNKMKLDRANNLTSMANPTYTDSNNESADNSDSNEESDVEDTDTRFKEAIHSANHYNLLHCCPAHAPVAFDFCV